MATRKAKGGGFVKGKKGVNPFADKAAPPPMPPAPKKKTKHKMKGA